MTTHEAKPVGKNCKWWINESLCDFMYTKPGGEAYKKGHGVGIEVTALNDSGLWVQLKTGPDFGCVNYHKLEGK